MAEIKSKVEKLELLNGETVDLTFNYARLLWLRNNGYSKEIELAMRIINSKEVDTLELPYYFYAAYLCANKDIKYTKDEFLELVPWNLEKNFELFGLLLGKKKDEISKVRSSARSKKAK